MRIGSMQENRKVNHIDRNEIRKKGKALVIFKADMTMRTMCDIISQKEAEAAEYVQTDEKNETAGK